MNPNHNKELEIAVLSGRMVTGDIWTKLSNLDLTEKLNDKEKWDEATTPEMREMIFHSLVVELTELILTQWRIEKTNNALRLGSMFIIQTLLNQAKPELKLEMLGWLRKSKDFFKEHNSMEAQLALLRKLEQGE
jgi:hypothetical protein